MPLINRKPSIQNQPTKLYPVTYEAAIPHRSLCPWKKCEGVAEFKVHEYANLFPVLDEVELEKLSADIKTNGQVEPAVLYEGKILDGRNRALVCAKLDLKLKTIEYSGDDPLAFVISKNLLRRHLAIGQRSLIAAKIANISVGQPKKYSANLQNTSQSQAAKQLNVSVRSVANAAKVYKNAIPEVINAVESGNLSVSVAATLSRAAPEKQRAAVAHKTKKAVSVAARAIKSELKNQNAMPAASTPRTVAVVGGTASPIEQDAEAIFQEIVHKIAVANELPALINQVKNMSHDEARFRKVCEQTLAMVQAVCLVVRPEDSELANRDSNDGQ
jgi:ParB-like chromosome segregation protein Spo0J